MLRREGGRFVDLRKIGEGAQGVVFDALDLERAERVALKVLKRDGSSDLEQFKREFRGLTELTHENLPLLYELFIDEHDWFFTMERIHGEDPRAYVTGAGRGVEVVDPSRLDLAKVTQILDQLEAVLGFVHQQGFVHGDVKPSNVKVRPSGSVVLLDFGLLARSNLARSGFAGTTLYAAPELLSGEHVVGPAQDLYALGSLAFELMAGAPPFPGLGVQPMLDKNRRAAPALRNAPDVPAGISERVARWLQREPRSRGAALLESQPDGHADAPKLAQLERAHARCVAGRTVVVDLEAHSDGSRASVLERFLLARGSDLDPPQIFRSRASLREHLPFNALDGILGGLGIHPEEGYRTTRVDLARELKSNLRARCGSGPVIMVIEDAHWLDIDSAAVLEELFFPPRPRSLLLVLARRRGTRLHSVARLPIAMEHILAEGPSQRAREHCSPLGSLDERVAALESRERALLEIVCLSRAPVSIPTLVLLDRTLQVSRVLERLNRLELARRESQTKAPFYVAWDEAVREHVLRGLSADERRRTHERLVEVLDPRDVAALAEHLRGAGLLARAREVTIEAALRATTQNAHAQAAGYLETALELTSDATLRLELGEKLLTVLERGGLTRRAARHAQKLADEVPPSAEQHIVFRVQAARLYLACGELPEGQRLLASLCERFNLRWPRSEVETLALNALEPYAARGRIESKLERRFTRAVADALALVDPPRGYLFQARVLADARARGDARQLAAALLGEVCYSTALGKGQSREVAVHLESISQLYPGGLPSDLAAFRRFAVALLEHHRLPSRRAVDAMLEVEREFASMPNVDSATLGMIGLVAGHGLQLIGDLPGLRAQSERLARDAEERKDAFLRATARFGGHRAWLADDAPDVSRHLLSQIPWADDPGGFHIQHWLRAEVELETSLYEDDIEGGWERMLGSRRVLTFSLLRRDKLIRICSNFVYGRAVIARLSRDPARVTPLEHTLLRKAILELARSESPAANLRGHMLSASFANVQRQPARSITHLDHARDLARTLDYPLYLGVIEFALSCLDRTRDPSRARDLLEQQGVAVPTRFLRVDLPGIEITT